MKEIRVLAVTACVVGIAHGYLAATALKKAAVKKGIQIKVETQGSLGIINQITVNDVRDADVIILAIDTNITGRERFTGKPKLTVKVAEAVRNPHQVLDKALELTNEQPRRPSRFFR